MYDKNVKSTMRVSQELHDKVEIFRRNNNLKTINSANIKLIELGLIRYEEDELIDYHLLHIIEKLDYLIALMENN